MVASKFETFKDFQTSNNLPSKNIHQNSHLEMFLTHITLCYMTTTDYTKYTYLFVTSPSNLWSSDRAQSRTLLALICASSIVKHYGNMLETYQKKIFLFNSNSSAIQGFQGRPNWYEYLSCIASLNLSLALPRNTELWFIADPLQRRLHSSILLEENLEEHLSCTTWWILWPIITGHPNRGYGNATYVKPRAVQGQPQCLAFAVSKLHSNHCQILF